MTSSPGEYPDGQANPAGPGGPGGPARPRWPVPTFTVVVRAAADVAPSAMAAPNPAPPASTSAPPSATATELGRLTPPLLQPSAEIVQPLGAMLALLAQRPPRRYHAGHRSDQPAHQLGNPRHSLGQHVFVVRPPPLGDGLRHVRALAVGRPCRPPIHPLALAASHAHALGDVVHLGLIVPRPIRDFVGRALRPLFRVALGRLIPNEPI